MSGVPLGYCRWALAGGVWTVQSNCPAGQVCAQMTSGNVTAADGKQVMVNGALNDTFNPQVYGIRAADFPGVLQDRITRLEQTHQRSAKIVSEHEKALKDAKAGSTVVDIPCVPAGNVANPSITLHKA